MRRLHRNRALACLPAIVLAAFFALAGRAALGDPPQDLALPSSTQRAARTSPAADEPKPFPATERHRPLAQASHQPTREPVALSKGAGNPSSRAPGALRSVLSLFAALGAVIGLLLATMWGLRRVLPKDTSALPSDVFQVLGRKPLLGRQQAQVVRFGNKLVLLSVSPLGAESLAEITDPAEVERLTGLCQQPAPGPATTVFRQVMDQFAREPAPSGFIGSGQASNLELAMRGLNRGKPREPHDA